MMFHYQKYMNKCWCVAWREESGRMAHTNPLPAIHMRTHEGRAQDLQQLGMYIQPVYVRTCVCMCVYISVFIFVFVCLHLFLRTSAYLLLPLLIPLLLLFSPLLTDRISQQLTVVMNSLMRYGQLSVCMCLWLCACINSMCAWCDLFVLHAFYFVLCMCSVWVFCVYCMCIVCVLYDCVLYVYCTTVHCMCIVCVYCTSGMCCIWRLVCKLL